MWNFKKKTAPPAAATPTASPDLDAHNKNALTKMLTKEQKQVGAVIDFKNGRLAKLTQIEDGQVKALEWYLHPGVNEAGNLLAQLQKDTSYPVMAVSAALAALAAACPLMTLQELSTYIIGKALPWQQEIATQALVKGLPFSREAYPGQPVQPRINLTVKPQISVPPAPAPVVSVIQEKAAPPPPPRMEVSEIERDANGFIKRVIKKAA